jgi:PAS domain S-box
VTMKITHKFLLLFVIVLIFPTIAIHQGVVRYTKHVVQTNIMTQNEQMTELVVNRIGNEVAGVILQLQLVAGVQDEERPHEDLMFERAKQAISNSTIIQSIYYLDENQSLVFEAPFHPELRGEIYRYAKFDHVRWSYTYVVTGLVENPRGEHVITAAVPVFYKDRVFRGVLVAELSSHYVSSILRSTGMPRGGFGFITDGEGKVIASTDEEDWGKDVSGEPVVQRLLGGDSGSVREMFREQPSVMTYQTMRFNWSLTIGVPEQTAFEPVKTLSTTLTYSYLGLYALILFLILVGRRQLLLPILRLTHFARKYRVGEESRMVPAPLIRQKDEIGDLARTLADMAMRIERNHRFLQDIIEGIPYALMTTDGEGRVTRVNEKWTDLFGYSFAQVEGKRIAELPDLPFTVPHAEEKEVTWKDKNGTTRILRVINSPFLNGTLTIAQDISQLKMWEAHVAQSEKLALIGQITTGIAHELKNPLAVLASSSELLKEEIRLNPNSEWVPTWIDDIDEEVRRMTQVVNEFLSFARTKREQPTDIELDRLFERVLNLTRIKLNELGIHVHKEYDHPLPAVRGRPNKLVQVFLNLLLNSMDAMKQGGTIVVRMIAQEKEVHVEIQDEGTGVPEEYLEWLFNPFFSTKENGLGLGLTIARDIMHEHGGELELDTKRERGTVVRCKFPLTYGKEETA